MRILETSYEQILGRPSGNSQKSFEYMGPAVVLFMPPVLYICTHIYCIYGHHLPTILYLRAKFQFQTCCSS